MSHFSVCVAIPHDKLATEMVAKFKSEKSDQSGRIYFDEGFSFPGSVFMEKTPNGEAQTEQSCQLDDLLNSSINSVLEEILAPYNEATEDSRYLEFEDRTEDCKADYASETSSAVKFPDGHIVGLYTRPFTARFVYDRSTKRFCEKANPLGKPGETDLSRSLQLIENYPINKLYSFDEYCDDYCGYSCENGRWGRRCNPNAQWDWWMVDGRFAAPFLVKNKEEYQRVSVARMGNIDWNEASRLALEGAKEEYEKLRAAYESGNVKALGPLHNIREDGLYAWGTLIYAKDESLEDFLRRTGNAESDRFPLQCYAFVDTDGTWHSQGDMGWFGFSSNDKEERSWHDEIQSFLASVSKDDFLAFVDCHI